MSKPLSEPIRAHCICKGLSLTLTASPIAPSFICHCTLCQRRVGSAFSTLSLFALTDAKWENPTKTAHGDFPVPETYKFIPEFDPSTNAPVPSGLGQIECSRCSFGVAAWVPKFNAIGVLTSSFERFDASDGVEKEGKTKAWDVVKPQAHIYYKWRMLDMKDGLKKWEEQPGGIEMQE